MLLKKFVHVDEKNSVMKFLVKSNIIGLNKDEFVLNSFVYEPLNRYDMS